MRVVAWVAAGCLAAGAAVVVLAMFLLRWPVEVHRWVQPPTVNYQRWDPYAVRVLEVSPVLWPWKRYEVWVTRAASGRHGHMRDYGFDYEVREEGYFGRCQVEWTSEGVTLVEPTGYRLFFPAKAFVAVR
jgi:hypothetical protein